MREKLIEILEDIGVMVDVPYKVDEDGCGIWDILGADYVADHLIANGVTIKGGSCKGCKWENRKRPQRCNCCRRNKHMQDGYTPMPPMEDNE